MDVLVTWLEKKTLIRLFFGTAFVVVLGVLVWKHREDPIGWLQETTRYRVLLGIAFFLVLGVHDVCMHRENPKRAKEYLFLLYAVFLGVLYAVIHDEITVTISPAYFIVAKGLAPVADTLRLDTAFLATEASYGPAAISGALVLIANNPSNRWPQIPYARLALVPGITLACAASGAVLGGLYGRLFPPASGLEYAHEFKVAPGADIRFVVVWCIHTGTYVGAGIGTLLSCIHVVRARRKAATIQKA